MRIFERESVSDRKLFTNDLHVNSPDIAVTRLRLTNDIFPIDGLDPDDIIEVIKWTMSICGRVRVTRDDLDHVFRWRPTGNIDLKKLNYFAELLADLLVGSYRTQTVTLRFFGEYWLLEETLWLDPLTKEYLAIVDENMWWINF